MSEIYFNNITNEILLSTTSGNTVVLAPDIWVPPVTSGLIHSFALSDNDEYDSGALTFTDPVNGLVMIATGSTPTINFTNGHTTASNTAIYGNDTLNGSLVSTTRAPLLPSGSTDRTLSLWLRHPGPVSTNQVWLNWGAAGSIDGRTGVNGMFMVVNYTPLKLYVDTYDGGVFNPDHDYANWHNIIWTFSSEGLKCYVDNVLKGTYTSGVDTHPNYYLSFLSAGPSFNYGKYTLGSLSNVAIYDRALDNTERGLMSNE